MRTNIWFCLIVVNIACCSIMIYQKSYAIALLNFSAFLFLLHTRDFYND